MAVKGVRIDKLGLTSEKAQKKLNSQVLIAWRTKWTSVTCVVGYMNFNSLYCRLHELQYLVL
jgi:hypothetical protein